MTQFAFTTQAELRAAFWQGFPVRPKRLRNGDFPTDVRLGWCDFVDMLARDGQISEALAQRATLE